ncbi:MAG: hypothetical protein ACK4FK_10485 [Ferrovibrio sp.]|uniref:hypothetical protein n=1 Tax=Ferrovibrio sp. TaxID=1917215 RepID=UPI00391B15C8
MRDQDSYCLSEADLFSNGARDLIFRFARPYLEQEGVTATELCFSRVRQRSLADDGNRLADMIERVSAMQVQQTRQPVLDRRRELTGMVNQAMRLVDSLTRQTPSDFVLTGAALSQLAAESPRHGEIRVGIIIAAQLSETTDWTGRAMLCLDLIESGAEAGVRALLEQTLAEMLRLDTAGPAFGFGETSCHVIDGCLVMIDPDASAERPLQKRVKALLTSGDTPILTEAVSDRIATALNQIGPLSDAPGFSEWAYLQHLKQRLQTNAALSADPLLQQALGNRFFRLAQAEPLRLALNNIPAFCNKALYLARLYPEVLDGTARRDLLAALTFYLEHRDFHSHFAEPGTSLDAMVEMAQTLDEALQNPALPDHRRDRFRNSILKQYMHIKSLAERRRDPRVMGGPNDAVLINGRRAPLRNWSALGVLFGPVEDTIRIGDSVDINVDVHNHAIDIRFDASADVVRVADGLVAARYYCKDSDVSERIQQYFAK